MATQIIKRDGTKTLFSRDKIVNAILLAFDAVDGSANSDYARSKAQNIAKYIEEVEFKSEKPLDIEDVQDMVERGLSALKNKAYGKEYILYRDKRTKERNRRSKTAREIYKKLMATDVQNANANVDEYSFGGRQGEVANEYLRNFALDELVSEQSRNNHINNEIYIHDASSYALGNHNCFDRKTRFITSKGIKSFEDFIDGQVIEVLSPDLTWRSAVVRHYGFQRLNKIILKKNRTEIEVFATKNHRWINKEGAFQEGVREGDKLFDEVYFWGEYDFNLLSFEEKKYWCYGFIMGDGTEETRYSKKDREYYKTGKTKVKLCGEKAKYLSHFQSIGYGLKCESKEPEVCGIDFNKEIPNFEKLPKEYLISFIHGLYAADGTKAHSVTTRKPIYSIQFSDKKLCDFVEKYFPVAGLYINSIKDKTGQKTNFGTRGYTKQYQFFGQKSSKFNWYVKEVVPNIKEDEVWCLEVEGTHAFVLENGIATGNCLSLPIDKLLAKGMKTRQVDIRPAGSVSTAFQLLAVAFQIQSLQMFGGVSATHVDWTMVPYVRKSFWKHYKDGYTYILGVDWTDAPDHSNLPIDFPDYLEEDEKVYNYALKMTEKEVYQAVEGMFHNLNSLQSRSGCQLPFSSINYGSCTLPEGRMVIKAILDNSIKGVGPLHSTSVFPCHIFQIGKGINLEPGDPNYDLFQLALKSTAQRLYPNYANLDVSMQKDWVRYDRDIKKNVINNLSKEDYDKLFNIISEDSDLADFLMLKPTKNKIVVVEKEQPFEAMSTMGCRTQNGADVNAKHSYVNNINNVIKNGILYDDYKSAAQKDGRGNICPVTIILPTIAMETKEICDLKYHTYSEETLVKEFMTFLDEKIHQAKDMLLERYGYICSQNFASAKFMWENKTMEGYVKAEGIQSAMRHGTLALGQLGLAECLQVLIGCNHTTEKGMNLAKEIESLYKTRCNEFKEQYMLNFGVYMTPSENLCYTAMQKFKNKYGEIPNVSDRDFFTNSMHVPVWEEMSPFEKIDVESQLTGYSSAGCITYVELDAGVKYNIQALESIVKYAMEKDIPYFAVNVPNDQCQECGYTDYINAECPMCGSSNIRRLRRVTGYLSTDYSHFNPGKVAEVEARVKHK